MCLLHCFRFIVSYLSKAADLNLPHMHSVPPFGDPTGISKKNSAWENYDTKLRCSDKYQMGIWCSQITNWLHKQMTIFYACAKTLCCYVFLLHSFRYTFEIMWGFEYGMNFHLLRSWAKLFSSCSPVLHQLTMSSIHSLHGLPLIHSVYNSKHQCL